jgi:hypothetical protein
VDEHALQVVKGCGEAVSAGQRLVHDLPINDGKTLKQ